MYLTVVHRRTNPCLSVSFSLRIGPPSNEGNDLDRKLLVDKLPTAKGTSYNSAERSHVVPCLDNTRTNLKRRIVDWLLDPNAPAVFWLKGMAGTGKSTVAQSIAELCAEENYLAANYFFARDKALHQTMQYFFPTLAHQLSEFDIRLIPFLAQVVQTQSRLNDVNYSAQFRPLITQPLEDLRRIVPSLFFPMAIVVDAIDECENNRDAKGVLSLLLSGKIQGPKRPDLKIFITSRPEPHIQATFDAAASTSLQRFVAHDIDSEEDVKNDIAMYLQQGFKNIQLENPRCFRTRKAPWPTQFEMKKLLQRSGQLFIYAALVLKFVGDPRLHPMEQLRIVLDAHREGQSQVYADLDDLYRQIILQDPKLDRVHAVIGSILLVFEPLSSMELEILLELEDGNADKTLQWLQSVLAIPSDEEQPIRLYHPSFHDFLTNKDRAGDLYLDPAVQHGRLARACSRIIQIGWPTWQTGEGVTNAHLRLFRYACTRWAYHLCRSDTSDPTLPQYLNNFLQSSIRKWFDALIRLELLNTLVMSVAEIFRSVGIASVLERPSY